VLTKNKTKARYYGIVFGNIAFVLRVAGIVVMNLNITVDDAVIALVAFTGQDLARLAKKPF